MTCSRSYLKMDHFGHQAVKVVVHSLCEALVGRPQLHFRVLEQPTTGGEGRGRVCKNRKGALLD